MDYYTTYDVGFLCFLVPVTPAAGTCDRAKQEPGFGRGCRRNNGDAGAQSAAPIRLGSRTIAKSLLPPVILSRAKNPSYGGEIHHLAQRGGL